MARTHGWRGDPPTTDDEAVARILEAARRCIDEQGARTSLSDVAVEVGVTRQTVYHYFASTEAVLRAVALDATGDFLDRGARHVRDIDDPLDALLESLAFTVERLSKDRYLSAWWSAEHAGTGAAGISSELAVALGRGVLDQLTARRPDVHLAEDDADEIVEWCLRALQSLLIDPGRPPRRGRELRRFLRAWLGPAIAIRLGVPAPVPEAGQPST